MEKYPLFVSCAPALEPILLEELKEMGIPESALRIDYRGVSVLEWDKNTIYRINYASRLASRVWMPLLHFKCLERRALYRHAMTIEWKNYLRPNWTFAIDANVHHKEIRNSVFAAQVVKDAICDQMRHRAGKRPDVQVQNPDVRIGLFIQHQHAVLSIDTSGEALHKRGYRQESVEAPLQETLAAAVLYLAKFSAESILFDPCCGSGTILIEAALMASRTPPGYLRKEWGFMRLPEYDVVDWLRVRNQIDAKRCTPSAKRIFGIDKSPGAVRVAKINAKGSGFGPQIEVEQADFREYHPSIIPNLIIANPPHGNRLDEEDLLRPLYRSLGDFIKRECAKPGKGFVFTSNMQLVKEVGLAAKKRHILCQSGLDARLLEFDVF